MVMDLKKHLVPGEIIPMELHFSNGKVLTVKAAVKKQVAEQGNLSG